jgi:hypothetical protein
MTISFNISSTIFIYTPSVPPEWNGLFIPVNVTVASVMACRLFRKLALGLFKDPVTERTISKIVIRDMGTIPQRQSGDTLDQVPLDNTSTDPNGAVNQRAWDTENRV